MTVTKTNHRTRTLVRAVHTPPDSDFDFDLAVVGLGYVGLPTALAEYESGGRVLGIDISAARLAAIEGSNVDATADNLALLRRALGSDRLRLSSTIAELSRARCVVICVPTPVDEQLVPDLTILSATCRSVVANAMRGQTIVLTSTTYVGCTRDLLVGPLAKRGLVAGVDLCVAFSPERIDPGTHGAVRSVPRVVGGVTPTCTQRAASHLGGLTRAVHQVSSPEVAELTKLVENTFRAVNIALVNEFAEISRVLGVDIAEVVAAASTKPYGYMPFMPGPGVGGHCIPCDPHYLLWQLRRTSAEVPLIERAMRSIAVRPYAVVRRAAELLGQRGRSLLGARVVLVGITYKPNVADVRESTALTILSALADAGAQVTYHDPHVPLLTHRGHSRISVAASEVAEADLVIVHTMHDDIGADVVDSARFVLDCTYRLAPSSRVARI